jgi:hypothetical protein
MNLVDRLLLADTKNIDQLETGVYKSKKLAKILGTEEETVDVTIREVKSRRLNDIISYQFDRNGKFDYARSFDAKLIMCTEGCVDPDLRNKDLQRYFGCGDARELCEKLFGIEINELSDAISALSGVSNDEDTEEEIKN